MWDVAPHHAAGLAAGLLALPAAVALQLSIRLMGRLRLPAARGWSHAYRSASGARRLAALLLAGTAGVHLGLALGHLAGEPLTSAIFLGDGLAYAALALAAFTARWWRPAAVTLLAVNVLGYLGVVLAGGEGPDQVGLLTKLVEVAALGLVLVPTPGEAEPSRRAARWAASAAVLPALVLVTGGSLWGVDLARPDRRHQHAGAVLQDANPVATPEQQAAAQRLWEETREAIAPYTDPRAARSAGYRPSGEEAGGVAHWGNDANGHGPVLDPRHPQALVYVRSRNGPVLAGAMYQMPKQGAFGPDPGGPLTVWHIHQHICWSVDGSFSLATPFSTCPFAMLDVSTPAMLHVWTVDNPRGGQFAVELDREVVSRLRRG